MRLYDVPGYDRPLMLSPEHAEELGVEEHRDPPDESAPRQEWAAYAVSQGADPGYVETATVQQLVDEFGG